MTAQQVPPIRHGTGGVITTQLNTLPGSGVQFVGVDSTGQYSHIVGYTAAEVNAVVSGYLPLTGGTLTGPLTISTTNLTQSNFLKLLYSPDALYFNSIDCIYSGTPSGQTMAFRLVGGWGTVTPLTLRGDGNVSFGGSIYIPSLTVGPNNTPATNTTLSLTAANLDSVFLSMAYQNTTYTHQISGAYGGVSDEQNLIRFGVTNRLGSVVNTVLTLYGDKKATFTGDVFFSTLGKGIAYTIGAGQRAGNATLVGGTVTVTNTSATINTVISLTRKTAGGTVGNLTYAVTAGASFTITSSNVLDTSVVSYEMVEVV